MPAVATRPYVMAGAALAAAGLVSVTPIAPRPSALPVLSIETRLVDAGASILNIPFNLFQDIVNIPNNEVEALNMLGNSLLFSGTWLGSSATNIWGEDPGDPPHFMSVIDMLVPFTAISGQGSPEPGFGDFSWADAASGQLGLSQQITLLLDAEIPASATSDATWSDPLIPVAPITGDTAIDRFLWNLAIFTGGTKFPLVDNWFQTPLSQLTSGTYNFGTVADPSAGVGPNGAVPTDNVFGFAGTHPEMGDIGYGVTAAGQTLNADGNPVNLMPWSNESFTLNLLYPFENFYNSLQAPVDPSTYLQGFQFPTLEEFGRALQTLAAGSVLAFDPYTPGNALSCVTGCGFPDFPTAPAIVEAINNLWPGNTSLQDWVNLFNTPSTGPGGLANPFGLTNDPTQEGINFANMFGSGPQNLFDFGNPSPAVGSPQGVETPSQFPVSPEMQNLIDLMQQNVFPGVDFPGTTGSSVQDFFHYLADLNGYTPIDYANPNWLIDYTPPPDFFSQLLGDLGLSAAPAAASTDWLATMLADVGLGGLGSLF